MFPVSSIKSRISFRNTECSSDTFNLAISPRASFLLLEENTKSFVSIIFAGISNCQIIQSCFVIVYGSMNLGENIHTCYLSWTTFSLYLTSSGSSAVTHCLVTDWPSKPHLQSTHCPVAGVTIRPSSEDALPAHPTCNFETVLRIQYHARCWGHPWTQELWL